MANTIKLLWVDDEMPSYSKHLRKIEEYGFHVFAARSALEGLQISGEHQFDVILTDIMMPGMGGFEFIEKTRRLQLKARYFILSGYLYENYYRNNVREMWERNFSLSVIDKPMPEPDSQYFENRFIRPLLQEAAKAIEDKGFAQRIVEALELKPNVAGIGIDLKALLFPAND